MARRFPWLKVVHHPREPRLRRRAAHRLRDAPPKELVFYTDGDAQYDPRELRGCSRPSRAEVDFVNGYKIGRSDPLHRIVIGRVYHWFVQARVRPAPARRRLRLPPDAPHASSTRSGCTRSSGVICVELMKKVQDHGFRIAAGARPPLPPHLRQEPVLQLPAGGAHAASTSPASGSSWSCGGEHLRARQRARRGAPRTAARERLPGLLPRAAASWSRAGSGFIGSNLVPHARRPRRAGARGRQPAARLRRQPVQPRRLRGPGPHQHRRRARPRHGVPGARPGGAVQPGRAGQPHRLDDRSLHGPRDQLPQPALDPRGRAQEQPRDQDRLRRHAPGLRQAAATCRSTRSTCCSRPT